MKFNLAAVAIPLVLLFASFLQTEQQRIIYVKHLEPPLHYPPLARQTRLSGTIVMKLKIAADGSVLAVQSSPGDSKTVGFGILRDDAEKIVKTWTFGCVGCPPNAPFEHTLRFHYTIDEQDVIQDNRVIMNLPDEITIYTTPVVINPDGQSKNSKKGHP
ncbi:MAG: energy transducer TonB [Candidatus Acidiferrum sp.]